LNAFGFDWFFGCQDEDYGIDFDGEWEWSEDGQQGAGFEHFHMAHIGGFGSASYPC
jgi:hypothetical protein